MQVKKAKTVHDVRGSRINCLNFIKCPLCYGCRNYVSTDAECNICFRENKKINLCNTNLHRNDLISQMITKNNILLDEPINFQA